MDLTLLSASLVILCRHTSPLQSLWFCFTEPLATLAGAYHDVTGQRLEALWQEAVALWGQRLVELLPVVLEEPQLLRGPAQATLHSFTTALDMVRSSVTLGDIIFSQASRERLKSVFV